MMNQMKTTGWKDSMNRGAAVEAHIKSLLEKENADFTYHELPEGEKDKAYWDALKLQHKGDFLLKKTGVYIEVKLDEKALHYGNLFFELGEVFPDDDHIRIVGPLKHLKQPTVFVQAVGEAKNRQYLVFTAQDFEQLTHSPGVLTWKGNDDSVDLGRSKIKLSLLMKRFDKQIAESKQLRSIFTIATTDEQLIEAIRRKATKAARDFDKQKEVTHDIFWRTVSGFNQEWKWRDLGWQLFDVTFGGEYRKRK